VRESDSLLLRQYSPMDSRSFQFGDVSGWNLHDNRGTWQSAREKSSLHEQESDDKLTEPKHQPKT
jgi:hypothetical protein